MVADTDSGFKISEQPKTKVQARPQELRKKLGPRKRNASIKKCHKNAKKTFRKRKKRHACLPQKRKVVILWGTETQFRNVNFGPF